MLSKWLLLFYPLEFVGRLEGPSFIRCVCERCSCMRVMATYHVDCIWVTIAEEIHEKGCRFRVLVSATSYTHRQTTGAYPYTAGSYPGTAVTRYGVAWPYSYSYYQHQLTSSLPRPATAQTTATVSTTTVLPTSTQRTTFTAYKPVYPGVREIAGTAAISGTSSRGYKI